MLYLHNSAALEGQQLLEDIFNEDVSHGNVALSMLQVHRPSGGHIYIDDPTGGLALLGAIFGYHIHASKAIESNVLEKLQRYGYNDVATFYDDHSENLFPQQFDMIACAIDVDLQPKAQAVLSHLKQLKPGGLLFLTIRHGRRTNLFKRRTHRVVKQIHESINHQSIRYQFTTKHHGFISSMRGWKRMRTMRSMLDTFIFNRIIPSPFLSSATIIVQGNQNFQP